MTILTNIIAIMLVLLLNDNQNEYISNKDLDYQNNWDILRERTEVSIKIGEITEEQAQQKYSKFRIMLLGQQAGKDDHVLERHFKKLGVDNVNQLKNELMDHHISVYQLNAVLGGILRLGNVLKVGGKNEKMPKRLKVYFKDRLGMTNSELIYIMRTTKKIVYGDY
ncbi:MAG: hypothetical protein ACJZ12_02405 [Candidatus Neomarinimicrobiota bacterium]